MTSDVGPGTLTPRQRELIAELFRDLPTEFPASYEAAKEIRQAFHRELGRALHASVNDYFANVRQGTLEDARAMAAQLNETLNSLGLGIATTVDGVDRAAILVIDSSASRPDIPRYRLQVTDGTRKKVRQVSTAELPFPFEFMERPKRVEPLRRSIRDARAGDRSDEAISR